MKKGVKIKQFDITDCGAACLASVCAYYGLGAVSWSMYPPICLLTRREQIFGLIEAANKLPGQPKECELNSLRYCILSPKPIIAQQQVHQTIPAFCGDI